MWMGPTRGIWCFRGNFMTHYIYYNTLLHTITIMTRSSANSVVIAHVAHRRNAWPTHVPSCLRLSQSCLCHILSRWTLVFMETRCKLLCPAIRPGRRKKSLHTTAECLLGPQQWCCLSIRVRYNAACNGGGGSDWARGRFARGGGRFRGRACFKDPLFVRHLRTYVLYRHKKKKQMKLSISTPKARLTPT